MNRPANIVAVVGTGTDVGKTSVATQLLNEAKSRGYAVAARKPVQSFDPADPEMTDAYRLARITGEPVESVCPRHRSYPLAMAPPMAADALNRPRISLDDLLTEIRWPANIDFALLETAGGLYSPVAHDGNSIDLLRRLAPDQTLLIADAGLGVLNAVGLCLKALPNMRVSVFLNRFQDDNQLHQLNRHWLHDRDGIDATISVEEWWRTTSLRHRLDITDSH
jgi:dethiobiotin synthetase